MPLNILYKWCYPGFSMLLESGVSNCRRFRQGIDPGQSVPTPIPVPVSFSPPHDMNILYANCSPRGGRTDGLVKTHYAQALPALFVSVVVLAL